MKNLPGSIQADNAVRLRGDLTVTITDVASGRQTRQHIRNTITYDGLNSALYLWSQDAYAPALFQITTLVPGRNGTPPTRGDRSVVAPVAEGDRITLSPADRALSTSHGELVISGTLGTANANGQTLREVGLVMSNGQLLARQVHPDFLKTIAFTLTYTWRIAVTA